MLLPPGRKPIGLDWFATQAQDFSRVDRVEVIDTHGQVCVKIGVHEVGYVLQDNGRTLKLFLKYKEEEKINND